MLKSASAILTIVPSLDWNIANSDTLNTNKDSIWIVSDNKRSDQYLKNWPKIINSTVMDIISKLAWFCQRKQVSPVDTVACRCAWNETTDKLACTLTPVPLS
ncbi:hypothetical protein TNCV_402101 [Trichonephila clavipes]|nr:hypothetical protein TNCV_402101 [Trichonephila clavipes]